MSALNFSILTTVVIVVILIAICKYIAHSLDTDLSGFILLIAILSSLILCGVGYATNKYVDNNYIEDTVVENYPLLSAEESKYINVSGGKTNTTYALYKDADGDFNTVNLSTTTVTSDGKGSRYTKYLRKCKFIYKYVSIVNID